jgi:nitrogen fixation protein NifZ
MSDSFRSSGSQFSAGDLVVAVKDLRQDGTYPDPEFAVGDVIVSKGTPGQVVDVGVYLNEHVVYAVAFTGLRLVGCLEREITALPVDEPSFETSSDVPNGEDVERSALPAPTVHH